MLKDMRKELAEAVGAIPYIPDRVNPPVVLISQADPYLTPETVCDIQVNYVLTVIAARQESELANDALDDEIDRVFEVLPTDYLWVQVGQPFVLNQNGADYLATRIDVQTTY